MFNFGIPHEHSYELKDDMDYDAFKDLKRFHEAGGDNAGYDDTDFFYYEIERRDILEIGSEIYYKQKNYTFSAHKRYMGLDYMNASEKFDKYFRGYRWGNYLSKKHIELLGGINSFIVFRIPPVRPAVLESF